MPAYYYPAAVVAPAVPCVTPTAVVPPPVFDPPAQPGIDSGLLSLYKNYKDPSESGNSDVLKTVTDASAKKLFGPIAEHFANPDAACSNHGIVAELRPNGRVICICDLGWISEDCSVPLKNWGAFKKCSSNKPGQCDKGMQCETWSLVDLGEVNRCACSPLSTHPACASDSLVDQPTGNLRCGGGDGCPAGLLCRTSPGIYCGCPFASSGSNPMCQCAGSIPDRSNNYTLVQCNTECQAVPAVEGQADACTAYQPPMKEAAAPDPKGKACKNRIENTMKNGVCRRKPVMLDL